MESLWVAIDSRSDETRVLATVGARETVLKARLLPTVQHPRALPTLLEALAMSFVEMPFCRLWQLLEVD